MESFSQSTTGNTQSQLNFAAANPVNSGMIEGSTSETRYATSDFDPFLDLDIEPTQCKSSDVLIASPMISSTSSASGLVTVTPALRNTSLHSDTLERLSTAKHNDLISSTASTLRPYSGSVTSAPLGNVTSAPLGNVTSHQQPLTSIDHQQLHGSNCVDMRSFHDMKSISYLHKIRISRDVVRNASDVVRNASVRATHLGNFG